MFCSKTNQSIFEWIKPYDFDKSDDVKISSKDKKFFWNHMKINDSIAQHNESIDTIKEFKPLNYIISKVDDKLFFERLIMYVFNTSLGKH